MAIDAAPDSERVWLWDERQDRGAVTVRLVSRDDAGRYLNASIVPNHTIRMRRAIGTTAMDLILGSNIDFHLLSPKAQQVMSEHKFSGWATYPVEIEPAGIRGAVDGYAGLAVTGRCGPLRKDLSRQEVRANPAGRMVNRAVGMFFEPGTWDGSDVFMSTDGTGFIFVTDRVKEALTQANLTNMRFTLAANYVWLA